MHGAPKSTYEDRYIRAEFPDWDQGALIGLNDYFIKSSDVGRSYALNYYEGYSGAEEVLRYGIEKCEEDPGCKVVGEHSHNEFRIYCTKEKLSGTNDGAEMCFGATECTGKILVISVVQSSEYMPLPMEEYKAILSSAECKV